jgi:3-methylcrotonyl-CoA carboxylase beta subunit
MLTTKIPFITVSRLRKAINSLRGSQRGGKRMQTIKSVVNPQDQTYQTNYSANLAAVERLNIELARSTKGGGEQYVKRHLARGRLLPRERVEMLLDEGSYFLEIAPPASEWKMNSPGPA